MEQLASVNYSLFMESFFSNSSDAISIIGSDNIIQYVNPAFETLYGLSAHEVVGENVWTLFPENPNDFPWMSTNILSGMAVAEYETRRKTKDGRWVDVSLTISPIQESSGSTYAYLTVGRNITEKKRIEDALRNVESMFRLIEENISDVVAVLNPSGFIEYASKSHELFLGIPLGEFVGNAPAQWVHSDDLHRIRDTFQKMLREKARTQTECRLQHSSGNWVDVEMVMTPILHENGEVRRIICVTRDITDRRRTEQLLLQAEKLSVVGQLGAALAHEIRNPLTSIKGFLQLLNKDSGQSGHYFEIIFSELHRIEEILGEFLTTVKPQVSDYTICDVREILQQSVSVMQPEAHMHNIEIQMSSCDNAMPVRGDKNKLKQVFVNVLKNAIESMERGGVIIAKVEYFGGDNVRIEVIDQGCGIHSNRLVQLGNPFYTTKEKGTGLGLTVCSKILDVHHGKMHFVSELGQGTTVFIEIPRYRATFTS